MFVMLTSKNEPAITVMVNLANIELIIPMENGGSELHFVDGSSITVLESMIDQVKGYNTVIRGWKEEVGEL